MTTNETDMVERSCRIPSILAKLFDSNGDGYGDLEGLIQKLDYIHDLGVDVIWLNPCYESPDKDNGYDISDYYRIMDKAGDMETFDRLLHEVHQRGMKLIIILS